MSAILNFSQLKCAAIFFFNKYVQFLPLCFATCGTLYFPSSTQSAGTYCKHVHLDHGCCSVLLQYVWCSVCDAAWALPICATVSYVLRCDVAMCVVQCVWCSVCIASTRKCILHFVKCHTLYFPVENVTHTFLFLSHMVPAKWVARWGHNYFIWSVLRYVTHFVSL